ncbi:MAG: DUF2007 domain-containing protein [Chloroflexi bacterium]|nr:DUF2007 domain-containing protein [Chloroflexota bacterium]MCC6897063.1 DUF2007 domain-containing protein [Anaerolineae bacterium]
MNEQRPIEWVTAYTAQNLPEAYIVVGRLKSAGIAHFIKPDSFGQIHGFNVGIHSGVEVLVNEADYDEAMEILDEG